MDEGKLRALFSVLGLPLAAEQPRKDWLIAPCPFAPTRHQGGTDAHPSFGIRIGAKTHYKCFSCGAHGDLEDLILDLRLEGLIPNKVAGEAMQLIACEAETLVVPSYDEVSQETDAKVFPFSEAWLASFPSALKFPAAMAYLAGRGVDESLTRFLDLRFDSSMNRVCFPIRDWSGTLVGFHGRLIHEGEPRYHAYKFKGHWNKLPWLGESWIDQYKPLLAVESVFDLAACLRVYPNTVCALSCSLTKAKIARLEECVPVVSMFDFGTGGDHARESLSRYLGSNVEHAIPPQNRGDPGAMQVDEIREILGSLNTPLELIEAE